MSGVARGDASVSHFDLVPCLTSNDIGHKIEMMELNEAKTLEFIEDYRQRICLWNVANPNYKNKNVRRKAIKELASKYAVTERAVLNKIKCLRSYFHRQHARVNRRKSGFTMDDTNTHGWFAYKYLTFILYQDEQDDKTGITLKTESQEYEDDVNIDEFDSQTTYDPIMVNSDSIKAEPLEELPPSKRRKTDHSPSSNSHKTRRKSKPKDHFSIFSEYIASRIRRLDDPALQNLAEQRINSVMSKIENIAPQKVLHDYSNENDYSAKRDRSFSRDSSSSISSDAPVSATPSPTPVCAELREFVD